MVCDLCGKKVSTTKTRIEGVVYDACSDCAKLGTDATPAQPKQKSSSRRQRSSPELFVRDDAGTVLRKKREELSKTHEEFAKQLHVKESLLQAWESQTRSPTVSEAKRLEKQLHISLLESGSGSADTGDYRSKPSGGGMTIADLLKKN